MGYGRHLHGKFWKIEKTGGASRLICFSPFWMVLPGLQKVGNSPHTLMKLSRFGLIVSKIWSPATGNPVTVIWLLDQIQLKASSDIRLKFVLSNTFCSRITITIIVIFRMLYYHRALGKPVLLETRYCWGGDEEGDLRTIFVYKIILADGDYFSLHHVVLPALPGIPLFDSRWGEGNNIKVKSHRWTTKHRSIKSTF